MIKELIKWILLALILVPANAVAHELGHYISYYFFGADEITLHFASVSANADNLSRLEKGIAALFGPIISYVFLCLAVIFTLKKFTPGWVIIGFVTTIRSLVNLPYVIARINGINPTPNFDEFNFSTYLNINPIYTSSVTLLIFCFAISYFTMLVFKKERFKGVVKLWFSTLIGLVFWAIVGKYILP